MWNDAAARRAGRFEMVPPPDSSDGAPASTERDRPADQLVQNLRTSSLPEMNNSLGYMIRPQTNCNRMSVKLIICETLHSSD